MAISFTKYGQEATELIGFECEAAVAIANGEWIPVAMATSREVDELVQKMRLSSALDDPRYTPIAAWGFDESDNPISVVALLPKGLYLELSSGMERVSFGVGPEAFMTPRPTLEQWRETFINAKRPAERISVETAREALDKLLSAACGCNTCPEREYGCNGESCHPDDGRSDAYELLDNFLWQCECDSKSKEVTISEA